MKSRNPLIGLALALVACGGSSRSATTTGELAITVTGLPSGAAANVQVSGPAGFSATVGGSKTLSNLSPGQYQIVASSVMSGGYDFGPAPATQTVLVVVGAPASAAVAYTAQTGALQVSIAGAAGATPPPVKVDGPGGYATALGESSTLPGLTPGDYHTTANRFARGGASYLGTPGTQSSVVTAGQTATASVVYAPITGALAITVSGLPNGVVASIQVTGPAAFSATVTGSQSLVDLAPGAYQIAPASVTAGFYDFGGGAAQGVAVVAGQVSTASVVYAATTGALTIGLTGVPGGATGTVQVSGPAGFSQQITSPQTLAHLSPGTYQMVAASFVAGGYDYAAANQSAAVSAGATALAAVTYAASSGSLSISVTGVPGGATASVLVTGPAGFSQSLSASTVLSHLAPGAYQVASSAFSFGGYRYAAGLATQAVTVTAGATATVSADYAPTTGVLAVTITGLPSGGLANVQVAGPGSFSAALSSSQTLGSLAPGSYQLTAAAVTSGSYDYGAATALQTVSVSAGATATASISYAPTTGALSLGVSGVPTGAAVSVSITGPGNYSQTVAVSQSLAHLAPGSYQVAAPGFVFGGYDYVAAMPLQTVVVSAASTAAASAAYGPTTGALTVNTSGIPSGAPAPITVTGPASYAASVSASETLTRLTPGTYQVAAATFFYGSFTYAATVTSQQAPVTAGSTATAPVSYGATDGALSVVVTAAGGTPSVVVTGPSAFTATLTATQLLAHLAPGTYQIVAGSYSGTDYDYAATPASQSAAVSIGAIADASVTYAATTGALGVMVSGLPGSTAASVQVTGPAAFSQMLTASQTLSHLSPGSYSVAAAAVAVGSATYTPAPTSQTAAVSAGSTATAATVYSSTGHLSAGCGLAGKQTGDFHLATTDGQGTTRDFEVIVPSPYDSSTPLALSFVYHGAGGTEAGAKAFGLQNASGAASSGIFVFPQGINFQTYGVGWDDSCGGYDMVFFDHMLAALENNYCIDTTRVFAGGFSWGCDFVTGLTCCRGDKLRAVAAGSCSDDFSTASNYQTYLNLPCPVTNSAAIRFTHDASGGDSGYPAPYFATTSSLYQSFNACSSSSTPVSPSPCNSYGSCTNPFLECPYPGLGHALPASWADDTWTFFSAFH